MTDAADAELVTAFYGRWAALYDLLAEHTPGIATLRARAADSLALSPGDTVVEMGTGTGANLPYLRERVGPSGRVIGLDMTPGVLAYARARVDQRGWDNVHLLRADATRPPVGEADAVLATFVVGMFADPAAAVGRWCDLVDGGRVALVDSSSSPRRFSGPANLLFRGFVRVTAPPASKLLYEESPARVLDRRVAAARRALADRGTVERDEHRLLGFVRLTTATIDGQPSNRDRAAE